MIEGQFHVDMTDGYPNPIDHKLLVKVWTIHNGVKYQASHVINRPEDTTKTELEGITFTLRDYVVAKIRRDEEEREIDLTP
jgi:hypothetical protein